MSGDVELSVGIEPTRSVVVLPELVADKERVLRCDALRLFELRAVQLVAELGDGFIDHPAGAIDCTQRAMLEFSRWKQIPLKVAYS